jgi:PTS system fructose-specific IIC component
LLGTAIVGLLMYYVVGEPVAAALASDHELAQGHADQQRGLPRPVARRDDGLRHGRSVNKAAYAFATG